MQHNNTLTGFPAEVHEQQAAQWGRWLAYSALGVLVLGVILAAILWFAVLPDVGALTLCVAFAIVFGLMVVRQAILAERRDPRA